MAITDEEKRQLKKELLDEIKASSQGVTELDEATSLAGINSLPAMQGTKVVRVPVSLLAKPATDAAATAAAAAKKAEDAAKNTTDVANTTRDIAKEAAEQSAAARDGAAAAAKVVGEFSEIAWGNLSMFNVNVRCADTTYTLATALAALAALETADAVIYRKKGLVITYRTDTGRWETKQFTGASLDEWADEQAWRNFGSGGSGSGFYNLTVEQPLEGFYTLATAIAALADAGIEDESKPGMIITFEESAGCWVDYRFEGTNLDSFSTPAAWSRHGGGDAVKSITLNGVKLAPDESGAVPINFEQVEVDETLDAASTNPVQNATLTRKLAEVEAATVFGMAAEVSDDESTVRLALTNKSGAEIAAVDIPAGSGGGSGETIATKIVLNAVVDKPIIKEGDAALLTYTYDHQYTGGDESGTSTGQKADIRVQVQRGSTAMYDTILQGTSKGIYTLDLTPYLQVGTTDIYVRATTTDPTTGKTQTKQSYVSVRVVSLSLSSSYNLATGIAAGGYGASDNILVPYAVSGSGTKVVSLYVDGRQIEAQTVTRSGTTNGTFTLAASGLSAGRHTVQIVAEMEASDTLTLRSQSIYFDVLKSGSHAPFIGTMMTFADGRIFTTDYLTPVLRVGQYEQVSFDFVVYDPATTPATMAVYRDGSLTQSVSVPRSTQIYTNRFTEQGTMAMRFACGATEYPFSVEVMESGIDISEVAAGLRLKLSAAGRSNSEADPAEWRYGEIETLFDGFDWSSNGWTGDALKLTNGARIEIGDRPFAADATTDGATYEMELVCQNVTDRNGIVVDCMSGGVGFQLTTQQAVMRSSGGTEVSTLFASDITLKIAFVVDKKSGHRLMELYVNGIRCGAKQYGATEGLLQAAPAPIRIGSDSADVLLRNLRVYDRALSDDELLANYIVDRQTLDEMVVLFAENDVLDDEGAAVSMEKLRARGKAVMRIVGDVDLVNQTNNKKFEVPVDIYFYSPYGKEYDFVIRQAGLRIQGTSSTTYPRKNYRLYFNRSDKYGTTLEVNGKLVEDFRYSFKPGARPIDIFCLKADFSDSSSTHNTGAVRIVNDVWKRCGWLTPPQAAYNGPYDVRIGVDGFPMDLFYDNDGSGANVYLGKYNFNNEKSGSAAIYGFEGVEGFNDEASLAGERNRCICVEFLNNSESLCLFGTADLARFDEALEFRFKADTTWADAHADDRAAVERLWGWIDACKGNPGKFLAEYAEYFRNDSPFAWYLVTDYFMAVDNRAKNMMLATWDGMTWEFLPYDMDTLFGVRNDSVLKYGYAITHETIDESIGSYAFAGHDSVLWELVRGCPDKLREVAETLRSNMSLEYVLQVFNEEQMGNWSERIYNKDGAFKYIEPLTEGVATSEGTGFYDYLYALQGSRYAHRTFTIRNRFALLDSQYVAGTYRRDSFPVYFGYKFSGDHRKIRLTASERYYFGYGYTSGAPHQSAVLAEDAGSTVELTLDSDLIVNDPQYIYGASRIQGLDLTNVSHAILQTLNLNNCTALRTLDVSCAGTQSTLNALLVGGCKNLRSLNMTGLRAEAFAGLDLSANTKLETLRAGSSALTGVSFAAGAPLKLLVLPATLQTLELRYLNKLTDAGLALEGTANITRLVVDNCPGVDWRALLGRCANLRYLRITGVELMNDGSLLRSLASMGGVDEQGGNVPTCRLVGRCRLNRYMDDAELAAVRAHFPELNIFQPEWTCIETDDSVLDDAVISNLDNRTGYRFDNAYVPSGHITRILAQRHRALGKKTANGVVTTFPLHDANPNYYADVSDVSLATPADLTGKEGNVWMHEPHYWYKGVNDFLNQKKYSFFSSHESCPAVDGENVKLAKEEIEVVAGKAIRMGADYSTLDEAITDVPADSYCVVPLPAGYRQARFPSLQSAAYGAVWLNDAGTILGRMRATSSAGILNGMYLFGAIPEGATRLAFTIVNAADFDYVLLTTSLEVEAIEPDWCEHQECLCGVYEALLEDDFVKSVSGKVSTGMVSQGDFRVYAANSGPGFQLVDYEMHKDVANLFYAKYGRRDSQGQCGYGESSYAKPSGLTNLLGMRDTINPENKTTGAYYYDGDKLKDARSTNVLGYECWQGDKCEWVDKVVINPQKADYKWHIEMPDGATRVVQGVAAGGEYWPANMVHGRYMDIIVARNGGSQTSGYFDYQNLSGAIARVVYRSYYNAYANGGVSYAYSGSDSSYANASIGSRLAFRGQIVKATSVSEYKALPGVE
ncbi:LamG-like jellyroll fold domain-containing protein [Alistipes sp.]|uniref:LamG-like jellyroll fold domain-containing protein n=1 Tax=Alistipes sp. TaxID=1872444 RepID=UPI003AF14E10